MTVSFICCFCGDKFVGAEHKPWLVRDDSWCCDQCFNTYVVANPTKPPDKVVPFNKVATITDIKPSGTLTLVASGEYDICINTQPDGPQGKLLTIHPDGLVTFGPKFTTIDEASLEFWRQLAKVFPLFIAK
jgi:hypothetical protein